MTNFSSPDNRRVVLIKSQATNNRFYALVAPERGIRNADIVASIPDDLLLGVAYPCLEDGLNDFAVIRTTFETLDLFPEDDPIRDEMMEIINDARGNLVRRLTELRDKIDAHRAHFLGTDYNEFKSYALDIANRGYYRRNLDSMMKLNVFSSVAEAEGHNNAAEQKYFYEFGHGRTVEQMTDLPARPFLVALFDDVLRSVLDDSNYRNQYLFDRNVFQKFIAVMFVNYATTDPMFYGINKLDYGVSADKQMDETPLYLAISKELRHLEQQIGLGGNGASKTPTFAAPPLPIPTPLPTSPPLTPDQTALPDSAARTPAFEPEVAAETVTSDGAKRLSDEQAAALLPSALLNEEVLLGPLTSLCSAAALLLRKNDPETQRFARVILADASKLMDELKRLGIVSPFANDPGAIGH